MNVASSFIASDSRLSSPAVATLAGARRKLKSPVVKAGEGAPTGSRDCGTGSSEPTCASFSSA